MTVYYVPGHLDAIRLRLALPADRVICPSTTASADWRTFEDSLDQALMADALVVRSTDPQAATLLGWWLRQVSHTLDRTVLVGPRSLPWHWHPDIEAHATWLDFITTELDRHAVA